MGTIPGKAHGSHACGASDLPALHFPVEFPAAHTTKVSDDSAALSSRSGYTAKPLPAEPPDPIAARAFAELLCPPFLHP